MKVSLDDLPPEFEPSVYRSLYVDLGHIPDEELERHYRVSGVDAGRRANRLVSRQDFVATIPSDARALEIGPFAYPLLSGPNVRYFDVLDRDGLVARAKLGLDPKGVPEEIHYVSAEADLGIVDLTFDVVLSSHCIEHQPDLIRHLQSVGKLLVEGGAYYCLIPDKRYCFDHFIPESNLAEILVAHSEQRKVHTLRSVIEHLALTVHNDSSRHWAGDDGPQFDNFPARHKAALKAFADADGGYLDVHAWYFTPTNIVPILRVLADVNLIPFQIHRLYPTRVGSNEFWLVLRNSGI